MNYAMSEKVTATNIWGASLVDEAIAFEEMEREIARLQALISEKRPVCPHCKAVMQPIAYKGYYDRFDCWECQCESIPGATESRGSYA